MKLSKILCLLLCLVNLKWALAAEFTREQLHLATEQCTKEFLSDLSAQFEKQFVGNFTIKHRMIQTKHKADKLWVHSMRQPMTLLGPSLIRDQKTSSEGRLEFNQAADFSELTISWNVVENFDFFTEPLPFLKFEVMSPYFDKFGQAKRVHDRLKNLKIISQGEPDIHSLVNTKTEQPIPIKKLIRKHM